MPQCKALIGTFRHCAWCDCEFEMRVHRQRCCGTACGRRYSRDQDQKRVAALNHRIGRPPRDPEEDVKAAPAFAPTIIQKAAKLKGRPVIVETERVRHGMRIGWRDTSTGEIGGLWLAQDGEEKKAEIFAIVSLAKLAAATGYRENEKGTRECLSK